jgi:hypothetical protein
MVNRLPLATPAVRAYLVVVAATLVALAVLAGVAPHQATGDAWGHAVVVAVFAVVLPLRLRAARAGRRGAVRAVGVVAAVLFLANVVEALVPGFVPGWMRVQMVVVALLALVVVGDVVRWAVTPGRR